MRHYVTDLGVTGWFDLPTIQRALRDVEAGLFYGYPLCCIEEFCMDTLDGLYSGLRRGHIDTDDGRRYVPCTTCCERAGLKKVEICVPARS